MADKLSRDQLTQHVIDKIDPKVRASLSPRQFSSIEKAIKESRPLQGHPVDIRGVLPLFFSRYYYVLLMGRDRRPPTRRKEQVRRGNYLSKTALIILFGMGPCFMFFLFIAYLLKAVLGINLFSDLHLIDLIKFW